MKSSWLAHSVLISSLASVAPAHAQELLTFAKNYDLDTPTESADTDQVLASTNLTDATSYAITAQPDVPRNITMAVTDTTPSITVGTVTVTCLDINGTSFTDVLDLSVGLTYTGTKPCKTVVSIVTADVATLGGGGDETIIVGTGSVVAWIYCATSDTAPQPGSLAKTTASSTTVTAAPATTNPFAPIQIGDELFFRVAGTVYARIVTAKASAASITVDSAVDLSGNSGNGFPFSYRRRTCGYADTDGWLNVGRLEPVVYVGVNALTATGGVAWSLECRLTGTDVPTQVLDGTFTAAIVPGVPDLDASNMFTVAEPCGSVRVGLKFGTTDTAGTDAITALVSGRPWQF